MKSRIAVLIVLITLVSAWSLVAAQLVLAQEKAENAKPPIQPDIVLFCFSWDVIQVSFGAVDELCKRWPGVSPDMIKEALKDKTPKDRIYIWLGKSIDWSSPSEADKVKAFEEYAISLGYKETIIFGARAFPPIPVIFDSALGGHQKPAEMAVPIIVLPKPATPKTEIKAK